MESGYPNTIVTQKVLDLEYSRMGRLGPNPDELIEALRDKSPTEAEDFQRKQLEDALNLTKDIERNLKELISLLAAQVCNNIIFAPENNLDNLANQAKHTLITYHEFEAETAGEVSEGIKTNKNLVNSKEILLVLICNWHFSYIPGKEVLFQSKLVRILEALYIKDQ